MEINNFERISELIKEQIPLDNGEFFFVQIFIRGKDGHTEKGVNGNNKNRQHKIYCIRSAQELLEKEKEICDVCRTLNARAYIHLTPRNFKAVADKVLELFPTIYLSNPEGMRMIYSSACGQSYNHKKKLYLIDLDDDKAENQFVMKVKDCIALQCEPKEIAFEKIVIEIPTLHGKHLIVKPFNTEKFEEIFPDVDVHKNNPTLLYYKELE